jgi:cell wall assembly regulator SMI1
MDSLTRRIQAAVESGVRARSEFYRTVGLEDEQKLGGPASEEQIGLLERKVGQRLPPSYRKFLLLHDGWDMVDGTTDLLSLRDLLHGPRAAKIAAWQEKVRQYGETRFADGLVIGHSLVGQQRIILDPRQVNDEGEWTLIALDKDSQDDYESFVVWLEQSVVDYQELAREGAVPDRETSE